MMNAIRLLTLTLALVTFTVIGVDAKNKPESPEELLREKITQLIRKPDLKLVPLHERDVSVEFIVTRDNKILVLDIETFNQVLDKYIKNKLNYHVISVKGIRKMTPYRIDLTFEVK
jgi:hypothetical protein